MTLKISILKALHGDAFVVQIGAEPGETYRILIDGGPSECFEQVQGYKRTDGALKAVFDDMKEDNKRFDLIVITHVDDDHIAGLLKIFEHEEYRAVIGEHIWFNSGRLIARKMGGAIPVGSDIMINVRSSKLTSIQQGVTLEKRLEDWKIPQPLLVAAGKKFPHCPDGKKSSFEITVLSPTEKQLQGLLSKWEKENPSSLTSAQSNDYAKTVVELQANDSFQEDKSIHNASSIAFLIESGESKALFLGDALASTVCKSLRDLGYSEENPLKVGVCKLAHHGSKANTNLELLSLIRSKKFIVSTNGMKHGLPNKMTLARIRNKAPESEILFNYPGLKEKIFSKTELSDAKLLLRDIQGDIFL